MRRTKPYFYRLLQLSIPAAMLVLAACSTTPEQTGLEPAQADEPETGLVTIVKPFPENSFHDLLVAEFAIRRQQYDLALQLYMKQAKQTGDLGVIATAARLSQFVNNEAAALQSTAHWLTLKPDAAEAHFIRATALARSRRPLEALQHMEAVIGSDQESNFATLAASALAQSEMDQQAFETAIRDLLERHPDNLNLKTGVALTLQYRNQEEEALRLIREVLTADPSNMHALLIETRVLQQLGRINEAIDRLRFAVDEYPYHKRLRLNLAQLLTRSDIFQAKAQYTVLHNQHPEDDAIRLALALVNREIGDYESAKELLRDLLARSDQRDNAHYFLGRIAEQEEAWDAAMDHYRQVSGGDQLIAALTRLAVLRSEQDGLPQARADLAAARLRFPDQDIQIYLIESDLLFEHRLYKEGFALLSGALKRHPDNTNVLYARSLFSERQKNVALMEQDLRQILSNDPDNATALNALGYSLAILTDRLNEAQTLVSKALKLRPDDPAIQDSYGWIAFRLGDLEVAENYLSRAFSQSKDHEIAAHLGEVLWRLGRREQAISVWQQGLNNKPSSTIIEETLQRLQVNLPDSE
ncbi:tetratricopeptide (TPR) repeat protein [Litorivivens lipolytica]|uniref:Tetratricopeptide (TPR) repeat protein n=1 Tax=Litorivivens lipolytica TaxID=1524264 RepID=A0A7W4W460_9GAMM|nr:tetratricopeptide repeat protein [Litorivivens lipolytica]MBB3047140.1 tetratricopeptide (TPR) repeat protein [Litorivivens lipolytica]